MVTEIRILGLLIKDRIKESGRTQKVLTEYAHLIKYRMGSHEVSKEVCSRLGIIILRLSGEKTACDQLENELREIGGIEVERMVFNLQQQSG